MLEKQDNLLAKAEQFFKRAGSVAETDNFDYAIDLYLEGLRCAPEQLEKGHLELYTLAVHRQANGGKKPSVTEKVRHLRGKTPLDRMLNSEYLLAKDPQHLPYAEAMLKAAVAGEYNKTAKWIADMILQANNVAEKPSVQTYILLKDSYLAMGQLERAVIACRMAATLKPDDAELADEYNNLSAELAVDKGNYDTQDDFRSSMKDRQKQEERHTQQAALKTSDFHASAIAQARKELDKNPSSSVNILDLARALAETGNNDDEDQAVELLTDAYENKSDFSFKRLAGEIKIRQIKRKIRQTQTTLEANPADEKDESQLEQLLQHLKEFELEHYKLSMENYPTDLRAKYEYAVRLLQNEQYDQAIPLFQDAQRDPRCRIAAMDKIGLAFFKKGWFADAVDVFTKALDSQEIKDDAIAKELQYNLARSCEENGDKEKALQNYRQIAQMDFAYKDVKKRIDELRNK